MLARGRLTLQVVYRGLAHFQLPVRPPEIPFPADRREHIVMSNGDTRLTIPRANPVDPYTMGTVAREAALTPDEFRRLL